MLLTIHNHDNRYDCAKYQNETFETFSCWGRNVFGEISWYHGCWCQVINNHVTNYVVRTDSGGRLNIKMPSYQYRDSHVKDKTVSPTVLSLTWESPYMGKTVFILRRGPCLPCRRISDSCAISLSKNGKVFLFASEKLGMAMVTNGWEDVDSGSMTL